MRRFIPAILISAALAWTPTQAGAVVHAQYRPSYEARVTYVIQRSLGFAATYWQQVPPCGWPRVRITATPPPGVLGYWHSDCSIELRYSMFLRYWFNSQYDYQFVCQVIVHEWGHGIGWLHTDGGIMDAYQNNQPKVCKGVRF